MMNFVKVVILWLMLTSIATAAGMRPPPAETVETDHIGEAKPAVEGIADRVRDGINKAGAVKENTKEAAIETGGSLSDAAKGAFSTADTVQTHIRRNSTEKIEKLGRYVVESFRYLFPNGLGASGSLKLLGLSVSYGTAIWVTFISTYVMADALPRQQFAVMQCKLYPVYFRVMASGIGMILLSHCLTSAKGLSSTQIHVIQALNLLASLLVVLFNLNYLEPRANKIMFDLMKAEKEEGRGVEHPNDEPSVVRNIDSLVAPLLGKSRSAVASASPSENPQEKADSSSSARREMANLSEKLKKLNFYSSVLNIITLLSLTGHLLQLGRMVDI